MAVAGVVIPAGHAAGAGFAGQFAMALHHWKNNLGGLAVLTLVFMLVSWIPFANIGFIAGYLRSILKVTRGEGQPQIGDLFNAWDCFGNLLVYVVLIIIASAMLNLVPLLGALASTALAFLAFPGIYLIVDRNVNFTDAFKWGLASIQANPGDWLLTYLVAAVISGLGALLLFIGVILTMPLGSLIYGQQYEASKP
ncbi:MAG: hypothetical protein KUL75_07560 [Sterolibacterium sp.]|nr:hypothetical protein [Sterolibacterium sp.]